MTVTLDTNLFIDMAELRVGETPSCPLGSARIQAKDVDRSIELARAGMLSLWYTSTTDFEIYHPEALRIIIKLVQEGFFMKIPTLELGVITCQGVQEPYTRTTRKDPTCNFWFYHLPAGSYFLTGVIGYKSDGYTDFPLIRRIALPGKSPTLSSLSCPDSTAYLAR